MRLTAATILISSTLCAMSCSDDNPQTPSPDAAVPGPDAATDGCTVRLTATGDAQTTVKTALINAKVNDVICFADGNYTFTDELSLTVSKVTLRGNRTDRTKVVLDFSGQTGASNPNAFHAQGVTDFVIEGMVIKDPAGDGVRVTSGTNLTFRKLNVLWTAGQSRKAGAYGIYPVSSTNILIDECDVRGASDAGIYVGQSSKALVRNSHAEGNVAGIEIENTDDAEVVGNTAKGNTTGILVFNLPQLVRKTGSRTKMHDNIIETNNLPSFADGGIVAYLPPGAGVILFANDQAEIHNNTIRGNTSTAIVVIACQTVSFIAALNGGSLDCSDAAYDSYPEGIHIHDNTITDNGTDPQGFYDALAMATAQTPFFDIIWDGVKDASKPDNAANKVCIKNNGAATFANIDVDMLKLRSKDMAPHDCTHPALAGVTVTW